MTKPIEKTAESPTELEQFDPLKAEIIHFLQPVLSLRVTDFKSSQDACDAGNRITKYLKEVEKRKKSLTDPLNDKIKLIRKITAGIEEPLEKAKNYVKIQIAGFEVEQEKIRQAKQKALDDARREEERKADEDRKRLEDELEERRQAEIAVVEEERDFRAEALEMFGGTAPTVDVVAEAQKIDDHLDRERIEADAKADRERIERESKRKQEDWDLAQLRTKNTRKNWKCELVDVSLVPKEFLIVTLNEKAVLALARTGVQIPGVRTWQETSVAFGSNTYVPEMALASEEEDR